MQRPARLAVEEGVGSACRVAVVREHAASLAPGGKCRREENAAGSAVVDFLRRALPPSLTASQQTRPLHEPAPRKPTNHHPSTARPAAAPAARLNPMHLLAPAWKKPFLVRGWQPCSAIGPLLWHHSTGLCVGPGRTLRITTQHSLRCGTQRWKRPGIIQVSHQTVVVLFCGPFQPPVAAYLLITTPMLNAPFLIPVCPLCPSSPC